MKSVYMYMWEYIVRSDHLKAFEQTYGSSGEWVQLFRRARGYIRTELHRDVARPDRYVTIDYWETGQAWNTFRSKFSNEFESLDARCNEWTRSETEIGRFESIL
jgi:heme-degrading monooxygenase HmoA